MLTWENAVMGRYFRKADSADQGYLMPPDARAWLPERHLAWALLKHGPELKLEVGTSLEMEVQRDIPVDANRIQVAKAGS